MKCSVSRTHDEASKDEEWPGRDTRKWKQSQIVWKREGLSVKTETADTSPKLARDPASLQDEPSVDQHPVSPSLRRDVSARR